MYLKANPYIKHNNAFLVKYDMFNIYIEYTNVSLMNYLVFTWFSKIEKPSIKNTYPINKFVLVLI